MPISSSWGFLTLMKITCIIYEQHMSALEQKHLLSLHTLLERTEQFCGKNDSVKRFLCLTGLKNGKLGTVPFFVFGCG
jgi:hypothetical protein